MVEFYVVQVKLGGIKLEDVPERFREEVAALLDEAPESGR